MTEYASETGGVHDIRNLTPEIENKLKLEIARTNIVTVPTRRNDPTPTIKAVYLRLNFKLKD